MPLKIPAVQLMTRGFEIAVLLSEELNDISPAGNSCQ